MLQQVVYECRKAVCVRARRWEGGAKSPSRKCKPHPPPEASNQPAISMSGCCVKCWEGKFYEMLQACSIPRYGAESSRSPRELIRDMRNSSRFQSACRVRKHRTEVSRMFAHQEKWMEACVILVKQSHHAARSPPKSRHRWKVPSGICKRKVDPQPQRAPKPKIVLPEGGLGSLSHYGCPLTEKA